MAVLLETSKGDIVIDLYLDEAPNTCKNFLKLCKVKYYNNCLFHNVQRNFIAQTGDPTGTGKGGESVFGLLYGSQARFFEDEITPKRKHTKRGIVGMASAGPHLNASQFYITLADSLDSLDEKHTVFGVVSEGLEVLEAMNEVPVDDRGRPLQNIRIRHSIILDDPYDDPPQLAELIPDASPPPTFEHGDRLEEDWVPVEDTRPPEEIEKETRAAEATNRAVVLEMIGDLPEADVKPPSNMLFVCKLNPVTTEEDLEIIFSRFGNVTSCDIIRDYKTGDSLCYAFIGYDNDAACEAAYFKMNNVLIDDRRIRVDFSQSVSHIWRQFRRQGKKGGTADMAAEAAKHERGPADGGGKFERRGQQQQQQGGGMLFEHHDTQLIQQQQVRHHQRALAAAPASGDRYKDPRRGHGISSRRSRSRSSDRGRRRSRSVSSSGSRDGSGKKHKKHKKEKHKKDKHKHHSRSRERSPDRRPAADDKAWQQNRGSREGERGNRAVSERERAAAYNSSGRHRYPDSRDRGREGQRRHEDSSRHREHSRHADDRHRDRGRESEDRRERGGQGGSSRREDDKRGIWGQGR